MNKKVYIVGAHSRAQTLAEYLTYLDSDVRIEAYLYDNEEKNPEVIGAIPVVSMDKMTDLITDYPVYIGTRGIYHQSIIKKLKQMGFKSIYPVTQDLDLNLRNQYLQKYYAAIGRKFNKLNNLHSSEKFNNLEKQIKRTVYVVKSPLDKPLQQKYLLPSYEKEIWAGAVFAKGNIPNGAIRDDIENNISERNHQFCELTALYWIWQHAKEEIIGIVHYRRHFIMPSDWISRMLCHGIDVILPVPLYVAPSLEKNFKNRHDPSDWDYMMQCLKEFDIQEYQEAKKFFKGNLYSPCNMFIAKKQVLDDLCRWLFPILFKVAEHGGKKEDDYLNRYPGFISERLITYFFEKNRSRYQIAYADKNFLQ